MLPRAAVFMECEVEAKLAGATRLYAEMAGLAR